MATTEQCFTMQLDRSGWSSMADTCTLVRLLLGPTIKQQFHHLGLPTATTCNMATPRYRYHVQTIACRAEWAVLSAHHCHSQYCCNTAVATTTHSQHLSSTPAMHIHVIETCIKPQKLNKTLLLACAGLMQDTIQTQSSRAASHGKRHSLTTLMQC